MLEVLLFITAALCIRLKLPDPVWLSRNLMFYLAGIMMFSVSKEARMWAR